MRIADWRVAAACAVAEIERMLGLYRDLYRGFTVKHFHEQLAKRHNYTLGYTVTKLHLHGPAWCSRRRSARRTQEAAAPADGGHDAASGRFDACLAGGGCRQAEFFVVTMEDATSEIYSIFLVDEEGTASSFGAVSRGGGAARPVLLALYGPGQLLLPDAEAGGKVSKTVLTQVGRALKQLGIEHIPAYSPQARGRSERMFGTCRTVCRRN